VEVWSKHCRCHRRPDLGVETGLEPIGICPAGGRFHAGTARHPAPLVCMLEGNVRLVASLSISAPSSTGKHRKAIEASRTFHCQDLKHATSLCRRAFRLSIKWYPLNFSLPPFPRRRHTQHRRPRYHARRTFQQLNAIKRERGGLRTFSANLFIVRNRGSGYHSGACKWRTFFAHFHSEPLQVSVPEAISHMPFIRAEHVQHLATGTSLGCREHGYVALLFVNLCCGVDLCCLSFFTPSFIGRRDRILVSIIILILTCLRGLLT